MTAENISGGALPQRRRVIETQWRRFMEGDPAEGPQPVRAEIASSWRRSAEQAQGRPLHAPAEDESLVQRLWEGSALSQAVRHQKDHITALAEECGMLAAIAGPCGRLLWSYASRRMRRRAEAVNFTVGGCWDEAAVGTNAVGLALVLRHPVTVFSSEHFLPFVHDWVCYAAPILHPGTGACLGVLDLSSTWNRHSPLGQAAVTELARSIAGSLPPDEPRAELEIHALGQPRVCFRGRPLRLPHRQIEILCLLVLNPQGLNLEAFHAALYGDAPVATATLKAELSHLRRLLDGCIDSRPYRLRVPVWADFLEVWQALRRRETQEAFALYRGPFLPQSESPEIEEWRECIEAILGRALGDCKDTGVLLAGLCQGFGGQLVRERLAELAQG